MGRKVRRVPYKLCPANVQALSPDEIKVILRGADDLIDSGGRGMLAKILKGSRDKKLLKLNLEDSPVYGYYRDLTLANITARIDRVIVEGYLEIVYNYRLPVLNYTEKGWEIEKETLSDELLSKLREQLPAGDFAFAQELKDQNREVILLLLNKIEATGDRQYIPLLRAWSFIEVKKVKYAISEVISKLIS